MIVDAFMALSMLFVFLSGVATGAWLNAVTVRER